MKISSEKKKEIFVFLDRLKDQKLIDTSQADCCVWYL